MGLEAPGWINGRSVFERYDFAGDGANGPGVAAGLGFEVGVATALGPGGAVDDDGAGGGGIEGKLFDGAGAGLAKDHALAPGLSAVDRQEEEWIAGEGGDDLAGDPTVLEVDELGVIEVGAFDAGMGFDPGGAAVFAGQEDGR